VSLWDTAFTRGRRIPDRAAGGPNKLACGHSGRISRAPIRVAHSTPVPSGRSTRRLSIGRHSFGAVRPPGDGAVVAIPKVGGLHQPIGVVRDMPVPTRPRDHGALTAVPTGETPRARASGGEAGRTGTHVARVDGQNRVRDQGRCALAAPCCLNDENSRGRGTKVLVKCAMRPM
jgi:hypothetical protein